jgi:hypothetical protein
LEVSLRRQALAALAAAGAIAVPAAAAATSSKDDAVAITGHPAFSAKQFTNYGPVRAARRSSRLRRHRRAAAQHVQISPLLASIAECESHDNPRAIGGGGAFRGKYQFDYGTWASVGGHGDPAAAPEAEQDLRAQMLLERAGTSPWPVCG